MRSMGSVALGGVGLSHPFPYVCGGLQFGILSKTSGSREIWSAADLEVRVKAMAGSNRPTMLNGVARIRDPGGPEALPACESQR